MARRREEKAQFSPRQGTGEVSGPGFMPPAPWRARPNRLGLAQRQVHIPRRTVLRLTVRLTQTKSQSGSEFP